MIHVAYVSMCHTSFPEQGDACPDGCNSSRMHSIFKIPSILMFDSWDGWSAFLLDSDSWNPCALDEPLIIVSTKRKTQNQRKQTVNMSILLYKLIRASSIKGFVKLAWLGMGCAACRGVAATLWGWLKDSPNFFVRLDCGQGNIESPVKRDLRGLCLYLLLYSCPLRLRRKLTRIMKRPFSAVLPTIKVSVRSVYSAISLTFCQAPRIKRAHLRKASKLWGPVLRSSS
jgi:hypothetical protein